MTNTSIKFYKFSNHTTSADAIATAKAVNGAIVYIVDSKEIWIGGSTPTLAVAGSTDVSFSGNILTISTHNENGTISQQKLDFNDVASAEQTFKVFENVYNLMGTTPSGTQQTLDYTGTQYLTSAQTLVAADKALDTAIYNNSLKSTATGAIYDTEHLSQSWQGCVQGNIIAVGDTLDSDINKLDVKIAGLADEVIANEQVTQEAFTAVANSVGLEQDFSLDLSAASHPTLAIIQGDTSVKEALIDLDEYVTTKAGKVDDVQINGTTIVANKVANIAVQGTYNASTNKIATEQTVTDAINALDVATDTGAASVSGSTITIKAVQQENGKIKDGGTTTINLDNSYDAATNKIATVQTVTDKVNSLDTTQDVHDVVYTAASGNDGAKLTFKGVSETDGIIAQGSGTDVLQFAKVATTGAAADVSIADAQSKITATNVEDALTELATNIENLVGGMRYNGDISSATATLNTSTNDIRPGDIYLASGAFSIGTTSVEAGDMIVYKGTESTSTVALDNTNCTIIEKETDTMVTAGDTLADDYIVFGNGNKEVTTTSTVDSADYTVSAATLKDAITKANSALQSISHGTDGTYVTTTIGSKDSNNDQSVGVAVQQATVTYTPTSGSTDPNLSVETGDEGLLTDSAITPIKGYIDDKVSNVVSGLDVADYAQATVDATTTPGQTSITIKGIKEADGLIGASAAAQDTTVVADGTYDASNNKLATQSTVTNAIATLDADITSDDAAVARVEVVETDGKITDVVVTNVSADVYYTPSTASAAPVLGAQTATGAVTGADIATIKSYVDDRATLCWEEYQ